MLNDFIASGKWAFFGVKILGARNKNLFLIIKKFTLGFFSPYSLFPESLFHLKPLWRIANSIFHAGRQSVNCRFTGKQRERSVIIPKHARNM